MIDFLTDHFNTVVILFFLLGAYFAVAIRKRHHHIGKKKLEKAVKSGTHEPLSLHPHVDLTLCMGCGTCTKACPEGDILKLINHQATLVEPTKCVGHGECERACPYGAISLVYGTKTRGMDIPRITSDYETNVPGLYISGELGGMGLIRNAVKQGTLAAQHALSTLPSGLSNADVDLLIIGAGPAGIAASLTAVAQKKRYLCIEQNSFGGTVANFPRQKIVMSAPMELPIYGKMKFSKDRISKEELLELWNSIRVKAQLKIQEETKFESLERTKDLFNVKTNRGLIRARKVILAMGVRGSPRRLGLANEDLPKVTYNLIDPEQYQSNEIVVVGGGNAGVEAAIALAKPAYQNKVTLLVRSATFDRCNEANQNAINGMANQGQVEIWYNSAVEAIAADKLTIKKETAQVTIKNDYLFIFAGAEMPHKMLMSFGIAIDKKFGETIDKRKSES